MKPESIKTKADAEATAAHEWEHEIGEGHQKLFKGKKQYVEQRIVVLMAGLPHKPQVEKHEETETGGVS